MEDLWKNICQAVQTSWYFKSTIFRESRTSSSDLQAIHLQLHFPSREGKQSLFKRLFFWAIGLVTNNYCIVFISQGCAGFPTSLVLINCSLAAGDVMVSAGQEKPYSSRQSLIFSVGYKFFSFHSSCLWGVVGFCLWGETQKARQKLVELFSNLTYAISFAKGYTKWVYGRYLKENQ